MRVGVFGGTFDPVHLAHLVLAERCREVAGLEQVWFVPSFQPPHKLDRTPTRFELRVDMLGLAITAQPAFQVDPIEKDLPTPSFTAQLLETLTARHPGTEFALILGGDSLVDFPHWHRPADILNLAELVVVPRPGSAVESREAAVARLAQATGSDPATVRLQFVESPLLDIASRDIRNRVQRRQSIRYVVPRAVEEYIRERKLYLTA